MIPGLIRSWTERQLPGVAACYRVVRDELKLLRQTPRTTRLGFRIAGDRSMQDGEFEPEETAILSEYLPQADVLVDIGANAGYYTSLARAAGKRVVAVEPLQDNLRLLYRTLEANGWDDVEVWPVALSDRAGTADFFGGGTGASLVRGWGGGSEVYRRRVPLARLDDLLGSRFPGARLLFKVDVEGAEAALLNGAAQTLARVPRPVWLVESTLDLHHPGGNPRFREVFDLFWRHGYTALTADAERRRVESADVDRWVQSGKPDFGTHNWLFC